MPSPATPAKITVTREFLETIMQRGMEKGLEDGYKEGFEAGKEEAARNLEKIEAEAHTVGVTSGLLWGLNCPGTSGAIGRRLASFNAQCPTLSLLSKQ